MVCYSRQAWALLLHHQLIAIKLAFAVALVEEGCLEVGISCIVQTSKGAFQGIYCVVTTNVPQLETNPFQIICQSGLLASCRVHP